MVSILQLAVCFDGVGQATEPIVNIYLGEKNFDGIKKAMAVAIKASFFLVVITIPVLLFFGTYIAGAFGIADGKLLTETVSAIQIVSLDARLTTQKVIEIRDWAENEYKKRGFGTKAQMKAGLLIEETGMTIVDNNPNSEVLAELTLFFGDEPKIIIRDNGRHFDMTEDKLQSFRDYFLQSFIWAQNIGNKFLMTQNYNRHIFQMPSN